MKLFKILLMVLFLSQIIACSPSNADDEKESKKPIVEQKEKLASTTETITEKKTPKGTTPPPNIVVSEDETLAMEKRGGPFTLYGKNGAVSLADYKGKVVAVYFGYTQCPDVCPTNLAFLGAGLKQLTEKEVENVQAIFISVDPGRDTPELLADYTKYFYPTMIGISGTPEMVDPIVAAYGAYYEKISYSNSAMGYGISHTSETYIVDKKGKLSAILPHATSAKNIVEAIRKALN